MSNFVADFETTTYKNDCRVWAYAICDIDNLNNKIIGNDIDEFMEFCSKKRENHKIYFHRLEFDGQFIISWLFKNGYTHTVDQADRKSKTFNTIISDKGIYYQIEIIFERNGRSINKVTFENSYNLIPLSVKNISKTFKMPISKLNIDYNAERPKNHIITKEEKEYIFNDVEIVARALRIFFKAGLNRMTIGSCALNEFKKLMTESKFKLYFPTFDDYDADIRQAYRGGYTYLEPEFAGKTLGNGIILDINSTHPYTMYACDMPHGMPLPFEGKYKKDEMYPLYVQSIRCQFKLKKGYIPTVQIRYGTDFNISEYLTSSNDIDMVLHLTNIDLDIFLEHYEVYNLEYFGGWKFKSTHGLFDKYIRKWYNVKVRAKKKENWGIYEISKLMLNALYGKFGTLPVAKSKVPYLQKNGVVTYKDSLPEKIDGVYLAIAVFITSYSRQRIINAIQKVKNDYNSGKSKIQFVYADTDSLHCISDDFSIPEGLEIHETKIGKFKVEGTFRKAKFLRQKCYIEELRKNINEDYKMKIVVAGMPEECHKKVSFSNFKIGARYTGKLTPLRVPGGVVLEDIDFTIKK